MNTVTQTNELKSVLKLALPLGSRLLTGHPNTLVNRVTHLRTRPLMFTNVDEHALLLVSTDDLMKAPNPVSLDSVIEKLTQTRAGALGVQGSISPRTQQLAKMHNFPLLTLPERTTLMQVERAVQRLFDDCEAQFQHRATELQQALQRHAAGRRGLTTMLNEMARMLDRPVVIHDRQGNVINRGLPHSHGRSWDAHRALAAGADFVRRFDLEDRAFYEDDWQVIESPAGITAPLIMDGVLVGYISALTAGDRPDEFDLMSLEYTAPTITRELAHQQTVTVEPDTRRISRDWISDWLTSPATDDALLAIRASQDGFEPGMWYSVVLFHWTPGNDRGSVAFSPERMVKLLQNEVRQRRIHAPIGQYVDRAVMLFPLDEPQQTQRLKQLVGWLHESLSSAAPDGSITAGVGRPAMGLTTLRNSFREADRALALPPQVWDSAPVAFFGDVSLYGLLLNVNEPEMLTQFCDQWLESLINYDAQHNTDLLPTLSAYFANNGNMARTAHLLNIHRNTLVYRLGRITEILQLDMDDSNVRLNLHLALKIHRLLTGE